MQCCFKFKTAYSQFFSDNTVLNTITIIAQANSFVIDMCHTTPTIITKMFCVVTYVQLLWTTIKVKVTCYIVLAYSYEVNLYGRDCFKAPPTIDTDYSWL